jgi:hypothetical protein
MICSLAEPAAIEIVGGAAALLTYGASADQGRQLLKMGPRHPGGDICSAGRAIVLAPDCTPSRVGPLQGSFPVSYDGEPTVSHSTS